MAQDEITFYNEGHQLAARPKSIGGDTKRPMTSVNGPKF